MSSSPSSSLEKLIEKTNSIDTFLTSNSAELIIDPISPTVNFQNEQHLQSQPFSPLSKRANPSEEQIQLAILLSQHLSQFEEAQKRILDSLQKQEQIMISKLRQQQSRAQKLIDRINRKNDTGDPGNSRSTLEANGSGDNDAETSPGSKIQSAPTRDDSNKQEPKGGLL